jgi:rhodanese-related sulfurtransferase
MKANATLSINRVMAIVAMTLATMALVAGTPYPSTRSDPVQPLLGNLLSTPPTVVDIVTLATWIRDRKAGLQIIDLRTREDFEAFHLPTARNTSLLELAAVEPVLSGLTVLYGADEDQVLRGLILLRTIGVQEVHILEDGVGDWLRQIINPTLYVNPTLEERLAYERGLEVSAYFGGLARRNVVRQSDFDDSTESVLANTMRRGCSF